MIASDSTIERPAVEYQELFSRFAGAIQEHLDLKGAVDEEKVREIAQEVVQAARLPQPLEIHLPDGKVVALEERVHAQFSELIELVEEGHVNILMVGPAGSGKTTLAHNLAKALDRSFRFLSLSAGVSETHVLGRMLPQASGAWEFKVSAFLECYAQGGVFLLDEIDAADANVMVAINAALANGMLCNPINGEVYHRHPDCIILAAANTWGTGGDAMYVGRNALDAATLDRFVLAKVFVNYDTALECDLATAALGEDKGRELFEWVENLREKIAQFRIQRVASTRLVVAAIKCLQRPGKTMADVKRRFFVDFSRDEKSKLGVGGAL